jgi:hypothetical protein
MSFGQCDKCRAQIYWIKTIHGQWMPCDPEKRYFIKNKDGSRVYVTEKGATIRGDYARKEDAQGYGYRSHWASCPYSDHYRKQKQNERAQPVEAAKPAAIMPPAAAPEPPSEPYYEQISFFGMKAYTNQ